MERICFAELNSSASEVWENLMGVGIVTLVASSCFFIPFPPHLGSWGRRCLVSTPSWP